MNPKAGSDSLPGMDAKQETGTTGSEDRVTLLLDHLLHGGLLLTLFLAPFAILPDLHEFANLPQTVFLRISSVVLFLLWLVRGYVHGELTIARSPLYWPILAFLAWGLLSLLWAHNQYEALQTWMTWAPAGLFFFLVLNVERSRNRAHRYLAAIFAAGVVTALLGIGQHLLGLSFIPQSQPPAATFGNRNMAVHFIILCFPLGAGLLFSGRNRIPAWITGTCLGLMATYLLFTGTRGGWLCLFVELLLLILFLFSRSLRIRWSRSQVIAIAAVFVLPLVLSRIPPSGEGTSWKMARERTSEMVNYLREQESTGTILHRETIWKNTGSMIADRPWMGFGLGNHKVFYPRYHRAVMVDDRMGEKRLLRNVHNDYLQVIAELGIAGLALLALGGILLLKIAREKLRAPLPVETGWIAAGILVSLIGIGTNALVSFPFHRALPPTVALILAGLLATCPGKPAAKYWTIRKGAVALAGAVCTLGVLVWLARYDYSDLRAEKSLHQMKLLEQEKNWPDLLEESKTASAANPMRTKLLLYPGRALTELGRNEEAVEILERVIEDYPYHLNAELNLGVAYARAGRYRKAEETFKELLGLFPDDPKVRLNLGILHLTENRLEEAAREFREVLERRPGSVRAHRAMGKIHLREGRILEAEKSWKEVVHLRPNWSLGHQNLGNLYFQRFKNRREDGVHHLKRALELDPNLPEAEGIRRIIRTWEQGRVIPPRDGRK